MADSRVLDADEGFSRLELGLLDDGVVRADVQRSVVLFKDLRRPSAEEQRGRTQEGTHDGGLGLGDGHGEAVVVVGGGIE